MTTRITYFEESEPPSTREQGGRGIKRPGNALKAKTPKRCRLVGSSENQMHVHDEDMAEMDARIRIANEFKTLVVAILDERCASGCEFMKVLLDVIARLRKPSCGALTEILTRRYAPFQIQVRRFIKTVLPTVHRCHVAVKLCSAFKCLLDVLPADCACAFPIEQLDEAVSCRDQELRKFIDGILYIATKFGNKKAPTHQSVHLHNEDYRRVPLIPRWDELSINKPPLHLRPNIVDGPYEDWAHYFDVQFRLLREDFVAPLRRGIAAYRHGKRGKQLKDVRVFRRVQIVEPHPTRSGVYLVSFDISRYRTLGNQPEENKTLRFGSLLCLSSDNFSSVLFATVAESKPDGLQKGLVYIEIKANTEIHVSQLENEEYVMIEPSGAYFEPSYHFMSSLQNATAENMPFTRYFIENECTNVYPPKYLKDVTSCTYDMSYLYGPKRPAMPPLEFNILDPGQWPRANMIGEDQSQLDAIRLALTNEIAVIQGPPGTGKTYVGLKVVEALLSNRDKWAPDGESSILVVCSSNHALDQFLGGILDIKIKQSAAECSPSNPLMGPDCSEEVPSDDEHSSSTSDIISNQSDNRNSSSAEIVNDLEKSKLNLNPLIMRVGNRSKSKKIKPFTVENLMKCTASVSCAATRFQARKEKQEDHMSQYQQKLLTLSELKELVDDPNDWIELSHISSKDEECGHEIEIWLNGLKEPCVVSTSWLKQKEAADIGAIYGYIDNEEDAAVSTREPYSAGRNIATVTDQVYDNKVSGNHVGENRAEKDTLPLLNDTHTLPLLAHQIIEHTDASRIISDDNKHFDEDVENCESRSRKSIGTSELASLSENTSLFQALGTIEDVNDSSINDIICSESQALDNVSESSAVEDGQCSENDDQDEQVINNCRNSNTQHQPVHDTKTGGGWNVGCVVQNQFKIQMPSSKASKTNGSSVFDLPLYQRWELYKYWESKKYMKIEQQYLEMFERLQYPNDKRSVLTMTRDVVGMTTTGAAMNQDIIHILKPKIVIIEEAAEVLESHIVSTLSAATQHLILIGDHQQLRPKCDDFTAKKYNLDISLFERLILNDIPHATLNVQHRMRPEIAALVHPHIYETLYNHESVLHYENVKGITKNMYFISHSYDEERNNDEYTNTHEAEFVAALCKYLLQQGYHESDITVLTPYAGQRSKLRSVMREGTLSQVRIATVDDFQGEENDIILLSLVRSNKNGIVGFIKDSNRICVSLSRAKKGFYCIGNVSMLQQHSPIWRNILSYLKKKDFVGEGIPLKCQNHPSELFYAKLPEDFKVHCPNGGCKKKCNYQLTCGHYCGKYCHIQNHKDQKCKKPCQKLCSKGHSCHAKCFEECPPCAYVCEDLCEFGHIMKRYCHEPKGHCDEIVTRKSPNCPHEVSGACSVDPSSIVCRTIVGEKKCKSCGYISTVICSKANDPFTCEQMCPEVLLCGHRCSGVCGECCNARMHAACPYSIKVRHYCGNLSPLITCRGLDYSCEATYTVSCPHHEFTLPCSYPPPLCMQPCAWRCGHHKCSKKCCELCDRPPCTRRCSEELQCGHRCASLCGEPCLKVCPKCQKRKFLDKTKFVQLDDQGNLPKDQLYIQLTQCGHIFPVEYLDSYVEGRDRSRCSEVGLRLCPEPSCCGNVYTSHRYGNAMKQSLHDYVNVVHIVSLSSAINEIESEQNKFSTEDSTIATAVCNIKHIMDGEGTDKRQLQHLLKKICVAISYMKSISNAIAVEFSQACSNLVKLCSSKGGCDVSEQIVLDFTSELYRLFLKACCEELRPICTQTSDLRNELTVKCIDDYLLQFNENHSRRVSQEDFEKHLEDVCRMLGRNVVDVKCKLFASTRCDWYKCPEGSYHGSRFINMQNTA